MTTAAIAIVITSSSSVNALCFRLAEQAQAARLLVILKQADKLAACRHDGRPKLRTFAGWIDMRMAQSSDQLRISSSADVPLVLLQLVSFAWFGPHDQN